VRGARPRLGLGTLLAFLLLVYSAAFSALAPGGQWRNRVFDFVMWWDNDPGGWYVASAHELFSSPGSLLFEGHPALPMQIVLSLGQYVVYLLHGGPWSGLTFTESTARHLALVWWLSRLLTTAAHLLSFWALHRLARAMTGSERAALASALTYATSLPVLFFLSRVSVEPWVVCFFCVTFLALWRGEEALAAGAPRRAAIAFAVAAVAAVSGLYSKIHLLGLFPLFCLGPLLLPGASWPAGGQRLLTRRRLAVVAGFLVVALAVFGLYAALMDWSDFFRLWKPEVDAGAFEDGARGGGWDQALETRAFYFWSNLKPVAYLPGRSKSGLFALCELPFLLLASGATVALLRRREETARRFRWPALYALLTVAIWLPRSHGAGWNGFHYLVLVMALLAVAYGRALDQLLERLGVRALSPRACGLLILSTLLLHGTALWAVTDSRVQDVAIYREARLAAYYRALSGLGPGESLLIKGKHAFRFHGLADSLAAPGRTSRLIAEVDGRLVRYAALEPRERTFAALRARGVTRVLDLSGPVASVMALQDWRPR
jgi:hypothetical protein